MKKVFLLYTLCCMCLISYGQIHEEDFNAKSIPSGWTATSGPTGCSWQFGVTKSLVGSGFFTPASFPSGGVIFDDDACGGFTNNYVELKSPTINLVAENIVSAAIELTYNHQTFSNSGNFMVDVWDGSAWQNILFVDGDMPAPNSGNNKTSIIDVTNHINNAFKVKFIYDDENSYTYGVGIDHYKLINTATVGVQELVDVGFNYSPNPVIDDILTLRANENISLITIYNAIGQKVISKRPKTATSKVFMDQLPKGVYLMHVAVGQKNGAFKIIK